MGATDLVTGVLRWAVSGVRSVLPGGSGDHPGGSGDHPATPPPAAASDPATSPSSDERPAPAASAAAEPADELASTASADPVDEPAAAEPADEPDRSAAAAGPAAERAPAEPVDGPARSAPAQPAAAAPAPTASADPVDEPAAAAAPASPWSEEELDGFRAALDDEVARLRAELDLGEAELADLVADSGDGAGDDQADAGAKTFEREHEMSVNANTREMLDQARRAQRRLAAGSYGICESCGTPIGAGRLRAFPRATLCIDCKQAEERR